MWERCKIVNTCLPNLLACPCCCVALLLTFAGCLSNHFQVYITLENHAVESLHSFKNFSWAWTIQTKIACNNHLVYSRLVMKVLQHRFEGNLVPMYVRNDRNTHVISLYQGDKRTVKDIFTIPQKRGVRQIAASYRNYLRYPYTSFQKATRRHLGAFRGCSLDYPCWRPLGSFGAR